MALPPEEEILKIARELKVSTSLERSIRVVLAQGDRRAACLKLFGFVLGLYDDEQPKKAKQYYLRLGFSMKEARRLKKGLSDEGDTGAIAPRPIRDLEVNSVYIRLDDESSRYIKLSDTKHAKVIIKSKDFGLDGGAEELNPDELVFFVVIGKLEGSTTNQ